MNNKIRFSVNTRLFDKEPPHPISNYAEGFEPVSAPLSELAQYIKRGFAFSYQFHGNYRRSEYFQASDILVAEFNGGLFYEECLRIPFVEDYASLIYTTPSHTVDHHRFRLIFVLESTILDENEIRYATRSLVSRLGSEPKQDHPAALFLGSSESFPKQLGGVIPSDLLDEMIEDGKREVMSSSFKGNMPTANRSKLTLEPTFQVKLANGQKVSLREIEESTPAFCPLHHDEEPKAFVSNGRRGRFVHCRQCQKTWWVKSSLLSKGPFYDFDDMVLALKNRAVLKDVEMRTPLELAMNEKDIDTRNIILADERYLNPKRLKAWDMRTGVTFVKSPKGTGKTTFLAGIVKQATQRFSSLEELEMEDDIDSPSGWYTDERVLLIGHRQALIGELCQRLGLNSYLDDSGDLSQGEIRQRQMRYGVCLDSLGKVAGEKYDILVIDEVEQVLAHFLADTLGEKRRKIFELFCDIVRKARQVVLLDADLDWPTFKTLNLIRSQRNMTYEQTPKLKPPTPIRVYINNWKSRGREVTVYDGHDHLVEEFRRSILNGERIFVTSNSKAKIDAFKQIIAKLAKKAELEIPTFTITSDNSKSEEAQTFIKNVKSEILKYQVVMSSPSLGTGIDITFEGDEAKIDRVFGFFEARVTSHFEVDQQLARVRNPKRVDVWLSPQRFNFETEFKVAVDDVLRSDLIADVQFGFGHRDQTEIALEDPFLAMASLIVSKDRASKNKLKQNFIEFKRAQGWKVKLVGTDKAASSLGKAALDEAKDKSFEIAAEHLLNAVSLDEHSFLEIKHKLNYDHEIISQADRYRYDRTRIELFYRQVISRDLIGYDDRGKQREKIILFERLRLLCSDPTILKEVMTEETNTKLQRARIEILKDRSTAAALLIDLLKTTPIFKNLDFVVDAEFSSDDLEPFIAASLTLRRFVEGQLGIGTRKDLVKNPVQHLNALLKQIGLEVLEERKVRSGKTFKRYYKLDGLGLSGMREVAKARAAITGWDFVSDTYRYERAPRDGDDRWIRYPFGSQFDAPLTRAK